MRSLINKVSRMLYQQSIALAILRLFTGLIFFVHGYQKFQNIAGTEHFFVTLGMWAWVGAFIAALEVVGGVLLALGIGSRFWGFAFGIEMIVAIFVTGVSSGFAAHEFELLLAVVSFSIGLAGSGQYALGRISCAKCGGMLCRTESCMTVSPHP